MKKISNVKIGMCKVRYGKILSMIYFMRRSSSYFPDSNKGYRILIFCYGIPGRPLDETSPVIKNFLKEKKDCLVVCPEYIGTHSSYGKFTIKNAIKTIIKTIKFIKKGETRELWSQRSFSWKVKNISLIGGSFGGSIALVAGAKSDDVRNIIAIAAPIDWNTHAKIPGEEEDLENLYNVIKRGWKNLWRIRDKKDWKSFVSGKLGINPIEYVKNLKSKNVLLIHGKQDRIVSPERSKLLLSELQKRKGNCKLIFTEDKGHFGIQILTDKNLIKRVINFLEF